MIEQETYVQVITNEGSGYNVHSGVFTCPQAGIEAMRGITAQLVVNGTPKIHGVADPFHDHQDLQGGNTVVLRLQQGDVVEIEEQYGNHVEGYGTLGLTSFTGVLLYP
ncbi:C1QL4-like protein [Mya arenaria]|uniref:C1QL4-like protein n=1 Tax=Mya arenaria TaxID=6604 RepID=A0ABY7DV01_MYAAR|nr:C1QL4-like protein [Mya arenaria]